MLTESQNKSRKAIIKEMLKAGKSYASIGKKFKISRERVRQLTRKYNLYRIFEIGQTKNRKRFSKLRKRKLKYRLKRIRQDFLKKHNYLPEDRRYAVLLTKFRQKKRNCQRLGIPFNIKFDPSTLPKRCPF